MEIIDIYDPKKQKLDDLIANGYVFNFSDYISRGMDIFKQQIGLFVGYTLVFMLILAISGSTYVGSILVAGPLTVGFFIAAHKIHHGKSLEFSDFFQGFKFFVPLLIAELVTGVFVMLGFVALIIPGIYLAVAYGFVNKIIIFTGMDFWPAMEYSRKIISKNWFSFFGFHIVLGLINILGFLALGVGILFTIPITMCAIFAAYDDIIGTDAEDLA